jgi:hypothetical protein
MSKKQTCKKCFKEMRLGFNIKDEIWYKLPEKWHDNVLYIECFLEELEKEVPKQKICITDFYFLGIIGDLDNMDFGGTFIDNDYGKNRRIFLGD